VSIVVASAEEGLRAAVLRGLLAGGWPLRPVDDWDRLVAATVTADTQLVLVDPALPELDAPLLARLVASLGHAPRVRVLGGDRPPLVRIPATERAAVREARRVLGPGGFSAEERREIALWGLGEAPLATLTALTASPAPLWIVGEPGTGKERVARLLHRLSTPQAPFVVLAPGLGWEGAAGPGTLYLEAANRLDPTQVRQIVASTQGRWRVVGGSRDLGAPPGLDWQRLAIVPLRERPNDLVALTQLYLDRHTDRTGRGRRRFDRSFAAMLHGWRWPNNQRELEQFVVQVIARMPGAVLRARDVPEDLRALLQASASTVTRATVGFEELAEQQLRPVVAAYAAGVGPTLHELVVGSAERALIHLVLDRTGGNRKRAAQLLGLARNTLAARIRDLGIAASGPEVADD